MDYLNYGKRVQQQPQKVKPQGFGQQKVQLTKDDFSFGDLLNQQTTQPQVAPQTKETKDELVQLFPTPVLICPCPFKYGKELEWIKNQDSRDYNSSYSGFNSYYVDHRQSKDTFILDNPEMSRVKQFIEFKLKDFIIKVMGSDNELVITQSWFNKCGKGESHHLHRHPNSMISGVWYPFCHEKLPPIEFKIGQERETSFSIKKFNHFNCSSFMIHLNMGDLILFPSNLNHSVPPNQSDEERISLSFNTWFKGNLGDKKSLTYLPLDRCV